MPNSAAITSITDARRTTEVIMQFYRRVRRIWREWLSRRTRGTAADVGEV